MGWILLLVLSAPLLYCLWTFLLTTLLGDSPDRMLSGRGLKALGRESLLQYRLWAALPWDLLRPAADAWDGPNGPIVILIPGFTETDSIFKKLQTALSDAGLAYRIFRYDTFRSDPEVVIVRLERFLEQVAGEVPGRELVLVGHSLGALLAVRCEAWGADGSALRLVAFSAPWRGNLLAGLALGPCGRSLRPEGDFVAAVRIPEGPRVLNIRSIHDTLTVPTGSSILPGCPEVVVTDGRGHNSLVWSEEAVAHAAEWIRAEG